MYPVLSVTLSVLVLLAMILGHRIYFVVWPRRAIGRYQRSDPDRLQRYLARVVATPSLLGPAQKLTARSALMQMAQAEGRHSEAVAHGRAILSHLPERPHVTGFTAIEARIRIRLADSLEALDQIDEAATERTLAQECVDRSPGPDPRRSLARAKLLQREQRHGEAAASFLEALRLIPEANHAARAECLSHLALACYHAGRPVDALRHAEEALTLEPSQIILRTAHQIAAIAAAKLGRLDDAESHHRQAYELAVASRDTPAIGQILANLAEIQRKRGKLDEALVACREAAEVAPKTLRSSLAIQSMIFREWGQFDEALAILDRFEATKKQAIPAEERQVRRSLRLDRARIEAEAGRGDDAWIHLQEAIAEAGHDAMFGLKCNGAAAWVFAVRGLADDSKRVADQALTGLAAFEGDPSTSRAVLYDLGMAAWTRGDFEAGIDCWDHYFELSPDPVHRPTAFSFRGECRRRLGDESGAKLDFGEALAQEIDTHHARMARSRLG